MYINKETGEVITYFSKLDLETRAKSLIALYKQLEESQEIPWIYKESAQLKARKKRVAQQSAQTELQMSMFEKSESEKLNTP